MSSRDAASSSTSSPRSLGERLTACLRPCAPPVAIRFLADGQETTVRRRPDPSPEPNEHGRTGQVPAGCVFWIHGTRETFSTTAPDHANCSVGSLTHGFMSVEEAASKDDVCAVLESGWVDEAAVAQLPRVESTPAGVIYGPLGEQEASPDVVLLRIDGLGLMTLKDALPDLRIEGKPQCHIVAIAKAGTPAASVGCALSRARTGMAPEEMTCALPGSRLREIVEALEAAVTLDRQMATYASHDARRFA